jgi:maleylacetoacetate isomerase
MTTHATTLPQTLELYGYWRSSASWRVRWALELKGALYEYIPVNLLKEEHLSKKFKSLSPNASVPVLVINGTQVLAQSMAIIEWIEETYSLEEAQLFSGDFYRRAKIRELCEIINSDTAPLQNLRAQKKHSQNPDEKAAWTSDWIRRGLDAYDKTCAPLRGNWSVGNEVTAADIFLIPQVYNALRFGIDIKGEFSSLWDIYSRALKTPECHKASPEQQIDAIK